MKQERNIITLVSIVNFISISYKNKVKIVKVIKCNQQPKNIVTKFMYLYVCATKGATPHCPLSWVFNPRAIVYT